VTECAISECVRMSTSVHDRAKAHFRMSFCPTKQSGLGRRIQER